MGEDKNVSVTVRGARAACGCLEWQVLIILYLNMRMCCATTVVVMVGLE